MTNNRWPMTRGWWLVRIQKPCFSARNDLLA